MSWYHLVKHSQVETTEKPKAGRPEAYPHFTRYIIDGYNAGKPMLQLARELNIHQSAVRSVLVRNNIKIRSAEETRGDKPGHSLNSQIENDVIYLFSLGKSVEEVAKMMKLPRTKVIRILSRNGYSRNGPRPEENAEKVQPYNSLQSRPGTVWLKDLKPEDITEIIRLYKPKILGGEGMSIDDIAARYRTTERVIKNLLIKSNVFIPSRGDTWKDERIYSQPKEFNPYTPYRQVAPQPDPFLSRDHQFARRYLFNLLKNS